MTINKFEDTVKNYTLYITTIDNFLSVLISTVDIDPELRIDGNEFILSNKDTYAKIYRDSPYIKQSYWKSGIVEYNNYIKNTEINYNFHSRKRRLYDKYTIVPNNVNNMNGEIYPDL